MTKHYTFSYTVGEEDHVAFAHADDLLSAFNAVYVTIGANDAERIVDMFILSDGEDGPSELEPV